MIVFSAIWTSLDSRSGFQNFPRPLSYKPRRLGEHNGEILTQWLGYTPERVQELERKQILRSGPA